VCVFVWVYIYMYVYICIYTQIYTGERNFCVNLNAAFTKKLPVDLPPFNGNHAGLLYICLQYARR
jgi:hypothetical protein